MKKLTRDEMKNLMGGLYGGPGNGGGDGLTCATTCSKWNTSTLSMDTGTCSKGTDKVGNTYVDVSNFSLTGSC